MSIVRKTRRRKIFAVALGALCLALVFAWIGSSRDVFVALLAHRAVLLIAAIGLAGVLLLGTQELTDRLEHH